MFTNAVRLYTKTNPTFFDDTPCEAAVHELLQSSHEH
jgi:hypothetical protein